jgi:polyhydroxybutyrate depolymerase
MVRRSASLAVVGAVVALCAGSAHAWSATGTVKNKSGTALSGVAVTVQDSAAIATTTDATGAFQIGSSTSLRSLSEVSDWSLKVEGRDIEVLTPAQGRIEFALLDGTGRLLWSATAEIAGGAAQASLPVGMRPGAAYLRVRPEQGSGQVLAVTTGSDGLRVASHLVAPRALAGYPVLKFHKAGYRDTTYAMTAAAQTGLAIVLGDTGTATTTCPSAKLPAGDQTKTISVNGVSRTYILHVPSGYTGTTPVPLVVDYHPIGGSASGQESGTTYKPLTDAEGVVSVYPNGLASPNLGQAWNVEGCCTTANDTSFARAMVAEVKTLACINPKRVYAVGFSMGGGMTHFSACHLTDIFAAAAPAAFDLTQQNQPDCHPSRPITMVMFRGSADNVVPYAGGHSALVTGMAIDFLGAKGTFQQWATYDQCTGSASAEDANGCSTYSTCAGGTQVTLCTKQGGGHEQGNGSIGWPILKKYTLP